MLRHSLPAPRSRPAGLARAGPPAQRTPARLAGGFQISPTTAWRYLREAVDLLAATAPSLTQAMTGIARLAYAILDGTVIRTDRLSGPNDRPVFAQLSVRFRPRLRPRFGPLHRAPTCSPTGTPWPRGPTAA